MKQLTTLLTGAVIGALAARYLKQSQIASRVNQVVKDNWDKTAATFKTNWEKSAETVKSGLEKGSVGIKNSTIASLEAIEHASAAARERLQAHAGMDVDDATEVVAVEHKKTTTRKRRTTTKRAAAKSTDAQGAVKRSRGRPRKIVEPVAEVTVPEPATQPIAEEVAVAQVVDTNVKE